MAWKVIKQKTQNKIIGCSRGDSETIAVAIKKKGQPVEFVLPVDDEDTRALAQILSRAERGLSLKKVY